jgi:hypothetical protein
MLIPVLRLRYGWTVIVGYFVASIAFVLMTWQNFLFSSSANEAMTSFGDFVVLGRVPLVSRMLDAPAGIASVRLGDVLVALLVCSAVVWGAGAAFALRNRLTWKAMLAVGGSALYLASVLVAGFGWGYKAVFLLLTIPMIANLAESRRRLLAASGLGVLLLVAVQSVVVWNLVLATTSGLIAAGFSLGIGGMALILTTFKKESKPAIG